MAQPVASLTQASLEQLYGVFSDDKTLVGTRRGADIVNELSGILNRLYSTSITADVTVTDATDADVADFISGAGEFSTVRVSGDIVRNLGVGDLIDNALQTAKTAASAGSLAAGDVFVITSGTTVAYLGNQPVADFSTIRVFDFDGETRSDFVSIGS